MAFGKKIKDRLDENSINLTQKNHILDKQILKDNNLNISVD